MTPAEAHAAAAAEGLVLVRADNTTGFKGVSHSNIISKPFKAELWRAGRKRNLGYFATAEEAALAVARALGPEVVASALTPPMPEPAPMAPEETHAAAAAEGLTLLRADNTAGFLNVTRARIHESKPFVAEVSRGVRRHYLGCFATAEEAALAVARFLGPEGVVAVLAVNAAKALEPAPMTAAEANALAGAEGLALLRAENSTGFKGVGRQHSASKPFMASVMKRGNSKTYLGSFATAEEAALAVARFLGPEGVAAALAADAAEESEPAPMTAREALAAAAAVGLPLVRAENATGFKGVCRNGSAIKPFQANLYNAGRTNHLGYFATAEEAALAVARFLGQEVPAPPGRKRPAASGAGPSAPPSKRGKQAGPILHPRA